MKNIKYIFLTAVISLFFTACSTTRSVPQDDVYYSTTPHNVVAVKTTTTTVTQQNRGTKAAGTNAYHEGTVENISNSSGQTTTQTSTSDNYDVDYSARLKRFHDANDTTLDYYDDYYEGKSMQGDDQKNSSSSSSTSVTTSVSLGLGFGSPYFGSSWSFGFGYPYSSWGLGLGFGWGYPYYGWDYPYYGWGYYPPYYGYYPPYYGYYPPYFGYYPPVYGYYVPYYPGYSDPGYRSPVYQPRVNRNGGSSIPRGVVAGGSGVHVSPNGKSTARSSASATAVSRKRVPVNPEGRNGKMIKPDGSNTRPAGSVRYDVETARKRSEAIHAQGRLNKPNGGGAVKSYEGNRNPRFGISESRNRNVEGYRKPPAFRREERMPKPRFAKPKQYQSLESRAMRSSKEFYRTPVRSSYPQTHRAATVRSPRPARYNVYRPSGSRNTVYRAHPVRSGVKVYSAPTRTGSSPNIFRAPARRNSLGTTVPTRSFSAPTRSFSVPVRTNSSGSGGVRKSGGSGGIRR